MLRKALKRPCSSPGRLRRYRPNFVTLQMLERKSDHVLLIFVWWTFWADSITAGTYVMRDLSGAYHGSFCNLIDSVKQRQHQQDY